MTSAWHGEHPLEAPRAAAHDLERHTALLSVLNALPVPDSNTRTNMALTLGGALCDIAPDPLCGVVAERIGYRATLRGCGNSSIILSQMLRGAAAALAGHHLMSGREMAAALVHGSACAYEVVLCLSEGMMLTVVHCAGESVWCAIAYDEASLGAVLDTAVREARAARARMLQLLATLRQVEVRRCRWSGHAGAARSAATLRAQRNRRVVHTAGRSTSACQGSCRYSRLLHQFRDPSGDGIAGRDPACVRNARRLTSVAGDQALVKVHLHPATR